MAAGCNPLILQYEMAVILYTHYSVIYCYGSLQQCQREQFGIQ